ncbi:MAG: type III secretion system export apparatus subunit SctT [Rhodocyclaceae bacterium]|nr:type III secretion system export apparatus subunit SctT [Rhodocyclaceae bacterium]
MTGTTDAALYLDARAFLGALALALPRVMGMFAVLPIFNRQIMPGMMRYAVAAALAALAAPALMPQVAGSELSAPMVLLILAKEAFVGFVLGFLVAIPFWAFEAVGFFIDNQRGASVAATLNPVTGNDTSPLGILFNQAFIVFFFISGGFLLMLGLLYDSFRLWNVFAWFPTLRPETMPLLLDQLGRLVRIAVLLSAPAIVAMFLAEVGLALVSRFVPQLQVFFMAMPIKCAIAMLVLTIYMMTLFEYGGAYVRDLHQVVPFLDGQWMADRAP